MWIKKRAGNLPTKQVVLAIPFHSVGAALLALVDAYARVCGVEPMEWRCDKHDSRLQGVVARIPAARLLADNIAHIDLCHYFTATPDNAHTYYVRINDASPAQYDNAAESMFDDRGAQPAHPRVRRVLHSDDDNSDDGGDTSDTSTDTANGDTDECATDAGGVDACDGINDDDDDDDGDDDDTGNLADFVAHDDSDESVADDTDDSTRRRVHSMRPPETGTIRRGVDEILAMCITRQSEMPVRIYADADAQTQGGCYLGVAVRAAMHVLGANAILQALDLGCASDTLPQLYSVTQRRDVDAHTTYAFAHDEDAYAPWSLLQ